MRQHSAFWYTSGPRCVTERGDVCGLRGDVRPRVLFSSLDEALQGDHLSLHTRWQARQPLAPLHSKHNLHKTK